MSIRTPEVRSPNSRSMATPDGIVVARFPRIGRGPTFCPRAVAAGKRRHASGGPASGLMFAGHSATVRVEGLVRIAAIVLIVLGLVALLYGGITYTTREKVLDIGPIEATAKTRKTLPLSPVFGVVAVVGGIALWVAAARRWGGQ